MTNAMHEFARATASLARALDAAGDDRGDVMASERAAREAFRALIAEANAAEPKPCPVCPHTTAEHDEEGCFRCDCHFDLSYLSARPADAPSYVAPARQTRWGANTDLP